MQPQDLRLRRADGGVVLEEGDRPGPGQRHGDGPVRKPRPAARGAGRTADGIAVVAEAEPVEEQHDAARRSGTRAAEKPAGVPEMPERRVRRTP